MIRALGIIIARDLRLGMRAGGALGAGLIFFLSVVMVSAFAIGPDLGLLSRVGPAILWIGALLASLLGLERIFAADHEDGSLDLLQLAPLPMEAVAAAKGIAHWLMTGLSLAVAVPVFGILLGVSGKALFAAALLLLVGTPAITFLGLIGAAVSVALPSAGMLVAVLVLPFTIPRLIFGAAATQSAIAGEVFGTPFKLLLATALFGFVIGPVAAAAAIRLARS